MVTVTTGTDDVDSLGNIGEIDRGRETPHRRCCGGELGGRDSLDAQAEGEGSELGVGGVALHDLTHCPADLVLAEFLVTTDAVKDTGPGEVARRKTRGVQCLDVVRSR